MASYIGKRVVMMFFTLLIITGITFFLMHLIPGNPLEQEARQMPEEVLKNYMDKYGLGEPVYKQFLIFLKNAITKGDLGESISYPGRSVSKIIKETSPVSGLLGGISLIIGVTIGTIFGIVAALNRNKWPDYLVIFIAMLGVTIPIFVLAALFQYLLAVKLRWVPAIGWESPVNAVLPVLSMCFGPVASYARYTRSNVLEVMGQDYILTAEAKGVSKGNIMLKHVFRNAMLPLITMIGPQIAGIFTGSFIVENMFSIPGLGFWFVNSINIRDYTMIIGTTIFYAALFIVSTLIVDIVYGIVDPRIRLSGKGN